MNILSYLENDEGEEINSVEDTLEKKTELTSIQRAKRKYMAKYTKTEKFKEMNRENVKKHYDQNSKKIIEDRKKRMMENPELFEKFKERQRLYSAKRREMQKVIAKE
jgi:hypothetical protein